MTSPIRYLTGITTTGTPHLGNYVGALRPAVQASRRPGTENFYFLADYHALIKCDDPARMQRSTLEIAACWLATGLDPEAVFFYRQSDIPEITELTWLLTCVTGKGLLNRAHAYKAQLDKNLEAGLDPDQDVTAGLFMYPVLMAADILMFKAHRIPVGRDQVQHIEMARDMASSFNHLYGEHLVLPEAEVDESVAMLPGLDGRKMSKSYDNVIALFAPREQMRRQIFSIVTDSRAPGEPKEAQGSALFQIFQAFASADETQQLLDAYASGIAWSDAKQLLFERIDREIAPMREKYDHLVAHPGELEDILKRGAAKARERATPFMAELRDAVGLRNLARRAAPAKEAKAKAALPQFKQYREADGKFYFKLVDAQGRLLLQSKGFDSPQQAGRRVAELRSTASGPHLGDGMVELAPGIVLTEVSSALQELTDAGN
ncbi:MAG TPA: tryptophan--tRNA ligase [Ramlibacter sp.]|uniref:tryptophan--tRNA ligase n=1 Tax=Ramlibacter sp. TaxID=1917967 RepID=UPI002C694170|nr:tryptophan--tRNA ligase [Ramlibacter sp.]HVZ45980.1 tryptophan--tRNA ligase [Ramlibacter sp.]